MSVPTVLQTGNSCLVEMNTTIPLGNGYLGHQNGEGGRPVYIEIYDHAFGFLARTLLGYTLKCLKRGSRRIEKR